MPFFGWRNGRGDRAPTIVDNDDNTVNMIRYDHKCADFNGWKMARNVIPPFLDDLPVLVQNHFLVNHLAKQTFPALGHDGHEIGPGLGIINSRQAHGMALVGLGVEEGHRFFSEEHGGFLSTGQSPSTPPCPYEFVRTPGPSNSVPCCACRRCRAVPSRRSRRSAGI